MINPNILLKKIFGLWIEKNSNSSKDGKIKTLQTMSLYSNNLGIYLATKFIEEKTNEIPTGPKLLELFNLENIIVTFATLNTQENTIQTIVKQKIKLMRT